MQACTSLLIQGSSGCFELSATVHKGDGECWRTTFITFDPKYTLVNNSTKSLHVRYEGESKSSGEGSLELQVGPGESRPLWLPADVAVPRARVRRSNEYQWSNTFALDGVGEHYLRSRRMDSLLPVVVCVQVLVAGGLKATFEAEGQLPPFQLRNKTSYTLCYCQKGCAGGESMDMLPPKTTVPYTWENPEGCAELAVELDSIHGCRQVEALVSLDSIEGGNFEQHETAAASQPFLYCVLQDTLKIDHIIYLHVYSSLDGCSVLVCWELKPSVDTQMVMSTQIEELWENQRRASPWDDYSASKLFPSDRQQISDCHGVASSFEEQDNGLEFGWQWKDDWTTTENWQYAFNWHEHDEPWRDHSSGRSFVRRRRWQRTRVQFLLPDSVLGQVKDFRPTEQLAFGDEASMSSPYLGNNGEFTLDTPTHEKEKEDYCIGPPADDGADGEGWGWDGAPGEGEEEEEEMMYRNSAGRADFRGRTDTTDTLRCVSSPVSDIASELVEDSFEFEFSVVVLGFALCTPSGDPLATMSLGGVDFKFSRIKSSNKSASAWSMSLTVDTIQVDDDRAEARFPIALSIEHYSGKPLLQFVCSARLHSGAIAEIAYTSLLVQPVQVNLDECLLTQVMDLWNTVGLELPDPPSGVLRCRVGTMMLQPVKILLSFRRSPKAGNLISGTSMRYVFH